VLGGGVADELQVGRFQREDQVVLAQAAVEPPDHLGPEQRVVDGPRHLREQLAELGLGIGRLGLHGPDQSGEQAPRQQLGILREHAEHQPVQKMRDSPGRELAFLQPAAEFTEALGDLAGQFLRRDAGLERLGAFEHLAQEVELGGLVQVIQTELDLPRDRVRPIGVDDDPLHVGHDEVGRVLQVQGVGLELAQGGVQVLVLALVLPAEAALAPDIGPAVTAADLLGAALEAVGLAFRVGVRWGGLAKHVTQVDEVRLRRLTLAEPAVAPLLDELCWRHPVPDSAPA
jgi:hypothetical protein